MNKFSLRMLFNLQSTVYQNLLLHNKELLRYRGQDTLFSLAWLEIIRKYALPYTVVLHSFFYYPDIRCLFFLNHSFPLRKSIISIYFLFPLVSEFSKQKDSIWLRWQTGQHKSASTLLLTREFSSPTNHLNKMLIQFVFSDLHSLFRHFCVRTNAFVS